MDFNSLLGIIQIIIAGMQLRLDHFSRPVNRQLERQILQFEDMGDAIRTLEYALTETVAFIGQNQQREANPRLSQLWLDASRSIRSIQNDVGLADIAFEKSLYWQNPEYYINRGPLAIYRISIENVLNQLRTVSKKYNNLQKKIRIPVNRP